MQDTHQQTFIKTCSGKSGSLGAVASITPLKPVQVLAQGDLLWTSKRFKHLEPTNNLINQCEGANPVTSDTPWTPPTFHGNVNWDISGPFLWFRVARTSVSLLAAGVFFSSRGSFSARLVSCSTRWRTRCPSTPAWRAASCRLTGNDSPDRP